jgi:hypothetical protein
MRGSQRFGQLARELDRFQDLERTAAQPIRQRRITRVRHDYETTAIGCLANLMHGYGVGMVECGGSLRFREQASVRVLTFTACAPQEFQRDWSIQPGIMGEVNHSHAAAAHAAHDRVLANSLRWFFFRRARQQGGRVRRVDRLQEIRACVIVCAQESLELRPQGGVARSDALDKRIALAARQLDGLREQSGQVVPVVVTRGIHDDV